MIGQSTVLAPLKEGTDKPLPNQSAYVSNNVQDQLTADIRLNLTQRSIYFTQCWGNDELRMPLDPTPYYISFEGDAETRDTSGGCPNDFDHRTRQSYVAPDG